MKKLIVLALCLLVTVSGAFATDMVVGGGLLFHNITDDYGNSESGPGIFGFFGPNQFLELNAGISFYSVEGYDFKTFQVGIYGKYPIPLSDMLVVFPTGGIDYEMPLGDDLEGYLLWFRGGAGLDIFFSEKLFVRSHVILGYAMGDYGSGFGYLAKVGIGFMLD